MKNELKKLTTKQLIKLVKTFEHYPAVTLKDGKDYILSYLEDEACSISEKEIVEYLLKNGDKINQENILIDKDNWKLIKNDVEADYSYYLQNKNTEDIPAKANSFIGIKIYLNKSTDNNDLKEFEKELDKIIVAEKLKEQYDYIENIIFKPISSNNLFSLELKDNIFNRFEYHIDILTVQNEKTFIVQINNVIDLKIAHSANDL